MGITSKQAADEIEKEIIAAKTSHSEAVKELIQLWQIRTERNRAENKLNALKARVAALQKTLPKMSEDDQKIIDRHANLVEASEEINRALEDVDESQVSLTI